jgi:DNA-binding response OmpR family regulator
VIVDALLPDMSGFEAVTWLKEQRPAPLVLLVTYDGSRIAELASMKVGADACISKTELPERLLLVLQELLWV